MVIFSCFPVTPDKEEPFVQQKTVHVTLHLEPADYQELKIISILENTTVPRTIEGMVKRRLCLLHEENQIIYEKMTYPKADTREK